MFRFTSIAIALSALAAGCIQPPEENAATFEPASAPGREERIDGMTAEASHEDSIVACSDDGDPLLGLPRACAQRVLVVEGRIGLDELPVELVGSNGAIVIGQAEGDAWSFVAVYTVESATEDMARDALDTAWSWSHEEPTGGHALRAGPASTGTVDPMGLASTGRVSASEYALRLPAWLVLDLKALTDNGQIIVDGFDMRSVDLETDNGEIVLEGSVGDVRLHTDNGGVTGTLTPRAGGTWDLVTDNGQIVLSLPEGARFGYDVSAKVDNGQVVIGLRDGETTQREDGATFKTRGFAERAVQVRVAAEVDNGQIVLGGR